MLAIFHMSSGRDREAMAFEDKIRCGDASVGVFVRWLPAHLTVDHASLLKWSTEYKVEAMTKHPPT